MTKTPATPMRSAASIIPGQQQPNSTMKSDISPQAAGPVAHWIVAATKPKAEFIAKMFLERQGYDVYLPLFVSADTPQPTPMFPSYLFVDLEPCAGQWRPINNTTGISPRGVLRTGEAPSILPTRHIDTLIRREEAGVIRLKRRDAVRDLKPGEAVRIHEGPFTGFEGVFEREAADDRVRVLIDILGGVRSVSIDPGEVSRVA